MKKKAEFDKIAKYYDEIYRNYKEDIRFYVDEALKSKGRILEIACGTGRVYLEILKKGGDIYGIDISRKMLDKLKRKGKELKLKPKVHVADMKNFKFNFKFDLIIIPFRSFLHNITIDEQIKSLKNFKRHLKKNGGLILNFYYPDPIIISKTKNRNKRNKREAFFLDRINQIISACFTIGKKEKRFERFKIVHIYKREFELLLKLAGFRKWRVYGGFNYQPLKTFKQEMVWIIEK